MRNESKIGEVALGSAEGARSATGGEPSAAAEVKRWSAGRKREVVLRLMRENPLLSPYCRPQGAPLAEQVSPNDIDLEPYQAMANVPDPDLVIRTGGEQRISNFLLWQSTYAELYFTDTLWPDFDTSEMELALAWYAQREQRFGQTSQQIQDLAR